jgi:hypothetical protein
MPKKCFVIMPFSQTSEVRTEDYWNALYDKFLEPSIKNLGYECDRSKLIPLSIVNDVFAKLIDSDLVICVLTDSRHNVMYELAMRHTLCSGTVMIIDESQKNEIPFYFKNFGIIRYDENKRNQFEIALQENLRSLETSTQPDNPISAFLEQRPEKLISLFDEASTSPLEFKKLINNSKERAVVVGQNLSFLAQHSLLRKEILRTLEEKELWIQLIVADFKDDFIIKATREFVGESFIDDYKNCIKLFKDLQKEADSANLKGVIDIKLSSHIGNVSTSFLDPDNDRGLLEIVPILYNSTTKIRPRFVISKQNNKSTFSYYWGVYERLVRNFSRRISEVDISTLSNL